MVHTHMPRSTYFYFTFWDFTPVPQRLRSSQPGLPLLELIQAQIWQCQDHVHKAVVITFHIPSINTELSMTALKRPHKIHPGQISNFLLNTFHTAESSFTFTFSKYKHGKFYRDHCFSVVVKDNTSMDT